MAGKTYPTARSSFENGTNHFNDKPMITAGPNPGSRFRDNFTSLMQPLAARIGGGVRVATSTDHGASFTINELYSSGPGDHRRFPSGWAKRRSYLRGTLRANAIIHSMAQHLNTCHRLAKTLPLELASPNLSRRACLSSLDVIVRAESSRRIYAVDGLIRQTLPTFSFVSDASMSPRSVTDLFFSHRFNIGWSVDRDWRVNVVFYDTRNDLTSGMRRLLSGALERRWRQVGTHRTSR